MGLRSSTAVGHTAAVPGDYRCPACGQPTTDDLSPTGDTDTRWRNPFTGTAARQAAAEGRLEVWVHGWLVGAGRNVPMSRGLGERRQWWLGPVEMPVADLTRIVGPEPGMPFPRNEEDWMPRLSGIAESIRAGWDVPPIIAEHREGSAFLVNDGNHRYAAQCLMGQRTVTAIVRFTSEDAWLRAGRAAWAAGAPMEAGKQP
jgi:ParB-like nuclease domain